MKKIKSIFIIAIVVALASQVNINIFAPGFIIALSVAILPVFLYFYKQINPIEILFATGIIYSLYKGMFLYFSTNNFHITIRFIETDVLFYFSYGILFYLLYWKKKKKKKGITYLFFCAFLCDLLSNIIEISTMIHFRGYSYLMFQDLVIIAFVRAIISVCIILLIKHYKSLLIKEEHEERYRKLILMTSSIKSEIYFMNKNNSDIEDVMKKAYLLYKTISQQKYPSELKNLSLDIAKDVHEIKKDYISVIKGLEEMVGEKTDNVKMDIKDIVNIIGMDVMEYIKRNNPNVTLKFEIKNNFNVVEHFYLVCILRNLIYNSIEAMDKTKNGYVKILISKSQEECIFVISDNGKGIKEKDIEYIFNPGFSTKFNGETGDICRGIGLAHVNGIVNDVFSGTIDVHSITGKGTEFVIKIKQDKMEGVSVCDTI
ncbi:ATP-binding protein [Clostridium estertheticum]|uniref:ATP-binding protein n=1 Tax=Clostridium estertheticum TaxID=238834 RepID=UPI001C0B6F20|nr:ATP-binding protein [Clostridium estertheticum]MBU3071872.1 ATP-binding protein [Clostridium estertheticum]MBU3161964.1 ATP-binding protein [Clostridium estertheticum]MBU3183313.1 ATP-binding protein [Clostridium estertheticum]